jgi:lycopene cyclase domain-containing protein
MPEKYTYLLVDLLCFAVPFMFSFHPKINFHKQWRFFVLPCFVTAVFFSVWDIIFTRMGIWSFNSRYLCGIYLGNLPLEEYLFFVCIPYSSVFTYHCISSFLTFEKYRKAAFPLSIALIAFLITVAVLNLHKLYTSVTFLLLAGVLIVLLLRRVGFMAAFYVCFAIILVPFFLSNGILTGSMIAEPVVLYNNEYNLGIRMFTIPVEDTFYGMLLLLINIAGFEYLKHSSTRISSPLRL